MDSAAAMKVQAAVVGLLYTIQPPKRGKEYRTLSLLPDAKNRIIKDTNTGGYTLVLNNYKTRSLIWCSAGSSLLSRRFYGEYNVSLSPLEPTHTLLCKLLDHWHQLRRLMLSHGNTNHSYLFCTSSGGWFNDSAAWTRYLWQVFKNEQHQHVSVNVLRSSFITYLYNSPNVTHAGAFLSAVSTLSPTRSPLWQKSFQWLMRWIIPWKSKREHMIGGIQKKRPSLQEISVRTCCKLSWRRSQMKRWTINLIWFFLTLFLTGVHSAVH